MPPFDRDTALDPSSSIKILQWNCHSILNKIDFLRSIAEDYEGYCTV